MVKATFGVLSERDKQLVLETEPKALRELDEDQLLELHGRVRRARTKHQTNYRRASAGQVRADGARGLASPKSRRDAARAEVLEEALARVSRRLAAAARASAEELRAERLAPARAKAAKGSKGSKGSASGKAKSGAKPASSSKAKKAAPKERPVNKKRRASTTAKGKRNQARRDGR